MGAGEHTELKKLTWKDSKKEMEMNGEKIMATYSCRKIGMKVSGLTTAVACCIQEDNNTNAMILTGQV